MGEQIVKTNTLAPTNNQDNYVWDDIIQPVMGKNLDNSSGKLDPDYVYIGQKVADSTLITNANHKIYYGYQIYHRFKLNGKCNPHIHWVQEASQPNVPNWWIRYRFWRNGHDLGPWVEVAIDQASFTYNNTRLLQIHHIAVPIELVSESLNVSDYLDIELTRDSNNASGLFAGNDPVVGNVTFKGFDPHLQIDSSGSRFEFIK